MDELPSYTTYRLDGLSHIVIPLYREQLDKSWRNEEGSDSEDLRLLAWREDGPVSSVELIVWIMKSVKVVSHARHTNNVKSGATKPVVQGDNCGRFSGSFLGIDAR